MFSLRFTYSNYASNLKYNGPIKKQKVYLLESSKIKNKSLIIEDEKYIFCKYFIIASQTQPTFKTTKLSVGPFVM